MLGVRSFRQSSATHSGFQAAQLGGRLIGLTTVIRGRGQVLPACLSCRGFRRGIRRVRLAEAEAEAEVEMRSRLLEVADTCQIPSVEGEACQCLVPQAVP